MTLNHISRSNAKVIKDFVEKSSFEPKFISPCLILLILLYLHIITECMYEVCSNLELSPRSKYIDPWVKSLSGPYFSTLHYLPCTIPIKW